MMVKEIDIFGGTNKLIIDFLRSNELTTQKEIASSVYNERDPDVNMISTIRKNLTRLETREIIAKKKNDANAWVYKLTSDFKDEIEETEKRKKEQEKKKRTDEDYIDKMELFIDRRIKAGVLRDLTAGNYVTIDYDILDRADLELSDLAKNNVPQFVRVVQLAIERSDFPKKDSEIEIRISNVPDDIALKDLHEARQNKYINSQELIKVKGNIISETEVYPVVKEALWECNQCGHVDRVPSHEFIERRPPSHCSSCFKQDCFRRPPKGVTDDQKKLKLEELVLREKRTQLKVILDGPIATDERLRNKKTSTVIITGYMTKRKQDKTENKFEPFLKAVNFELIDFSSGIVLNDKDIKELHKHVKQPGFYDKLINSMCPSTYGLKREKEAFLLTALQGVEKDNLGSRVRDDIHMLIIGDPAKAKTVIASYMKPILPNCRIASGGDTSGVGITGAVTKEDGEWILKPGAFTLCNKGFLIIDEYNKMNPDDMSKLNIGMEGRQEITIDKAGIHETLPTDTSIVALMNPANGGYIDIMKPIKDQIPAGITDSLMSRFDIPLVTRDIVDEKEDEEIAKIMLNLPSNYQEDYFDSTFLKIFLDYARSLKPVMSVDEKQIMVNFYKNIRQAGNGDIRINTRFLRSLTRLSEARAKADLSDKVTVFHVKHACAFLASLYKELGFEESALLNILKDSETEKEADDILNALEVTA